MQCICPRYDYSYATYNFFGCKIRLAVQFLTWSINGTRSLLEQLGFLISIPKPNGKATEDELGLPGLEFMVQKTY